MNRPEQIKQRIHSWKSLSNMLHVWRFQQKKIVFTNGCFDIVHLGHLDYLSKAADLGDILILGLNTDASVQRLKGAGRPVVDELARAFMMASLRFVDAVVLFDQQTPYELIQLVQPDVLVKGKDYKAEEVVGYDIVTAKGGKVETIDLVPGYSTTALIQKIIRSENPA
ncbi:MAG TPA: D-glycero-beta-D-manno-heptose 1-phosphate adenylyltransferase [Bacteroidales bacterium]|nr:D-glycero-beta-D-manno-heptose 1-phosphate adenylyltransferase [Bacteroidales bacterium]HQQ12146.1 D-glycero-beta-D-manno-heptose 1-phosphate adenylyltransferase [Bacteroidales bacterium]